MSSGGYEPIIVGGLGLLLVVAGNGGQRALGLLIIVAALVWLIATPVR